MLGGTFPIPTFSSARKNVRHEALFEFDSQNVLGDADRKVLVTASLADSLASLLTGDPRRGGRSAGDAAVAGVASHRGGEMVSRPPSFLTLSLGETAADLAAAVLPAAVHVSLEANTLLTPHVHTALTRAVDALPLAEASVAGALRTLSLQTWTRLRLIVVTEDEIRVWACSASAVFPTGRSIIVVQSLAGFSLVYADHDPALTDVAWGGVYQGPGGFDPLARDLPVERREVERPLVLGAVRAW